MISHNDNCSKKNKQGNRTENDTQVNSMFQDGLPEKMTFVPAEK